MTFEEGVQKGARDVSLEGHSRASALQDMQGWKFKMKGLDEYSE